VTEALVGQATAVGRDLEARDRIVAAARRCFRRNGVAKTRIAAVAAEAGMVRQTVYDFVESRAQLLGLAMAARMAEFVDPVAERFHPGASSDVSDDLVELLAVMTEVMHADPECAELAAGMTPANALSFMSGPDSEAQPVVVGILAPVYVRAQEAGLLRPGLTVDEMAAWSRNALAPLAQRDDLTPGALRATIRRFVLPAFLRAP
jgi:AcrR family transcriptional regulator